MGGRQGKRRSHILLFIKVINPMQDNTAADVLLVEDSPDDAELTIHALTAGFDQLRLVHLKDGVQALNFVFGRKDYTEGGVRNDLKLVLIDLKLPRLDGLEVLHHSVEVRRRAFELPRFVRELRVHQGTPGHSARGRESGRDLDQECAALRQSGGEGAGAHPGACPEESRDRRHARRHGTGCVYG